MKEFVAETLIAERIGLRACFPRQKVVKRVGPKRKKVEEVRPLYPRYIFADVSLHGNAAINAICQLGPIVQVLRADGVPFMIPDREVHDLMRKSGQEFPTKVQHVTKSFVAGDAVRISDGAFFDKAGHLKSIERRHARVLIEMFGSRREVKVKLEALEAA